MILIIFDFSGPVVFKRKILYTMPSISRISSLGQGDNPSFEKNSTDLRDIPVNRLTETNFMNLENTPDRQHMHIDLKSSAELKFSSKTNNTNLDWKVFIWCCSNPSHEIIGYKCSNHYRPLTRRNVFDRVPVEVDRYYNDGHLAEFGCSVRGL